MKKVKLFETCNQRNCYTKKNEKANYFVCACCANFGETERLDEAIKLMEENARWDVSDLRIHEYASGTTWYFECER